MAPHDITQNKSMKCDICTLGITVAEYVLFHVGFNPDEGSRLKTQQMREEFCKQYHTKIRDLEKQDLYHIDNAYSKDIKTVVIPGNLLQIDEKPKRIKQQ